MAGKPKSAIKNGPSRYDFAIVALTAEKNGCTWDDKMLLEDIARSNSQIRQYVLRFFGHLHAMAEGIEPTRGESPAEYAISAAWRLIWSLTDGGAISKDRAHLLIDDDKTPPFSKEEYDRRLEKYFSRKVAQRVRWTEEMISAVDGDLTPAGGGEVVTFEAKET